jgi:hypothetical protein
MSRAKSAITVLKEETRTGPAKAACAHTQKINNQAFFIRQV